MGYHRTKKNKTYIIKPDNSCQGKGIMLTKTPKVDIKHCDNFVVQQYLSKVPPDTESSNHFLKLFQSLFKNITWSPLVLF